MSFFFSLAAFGLVALIGMNAWFYYHATGTVCDRLAAMWRGSMTIFALFWGGVVSFFVSSMDNLATWTQEPEFRIIADGLQKVLAPDWQKFVAVALPFFILPALGIWARHRTLPKR